MLREWSSMLRKESKLVIGDREKLSLLVCSSVLLGFLFECVGLFGLFFFSFM